MDEIQKKAGTMVLSQADALELFAFLLSSARTQLDEPANYASMRLLTAAEKLREFVINRVTPETKTLLERTSPLTTHAQIYTSDEGDYRDTLDKLCRMLAEFVVDSSGINEEVS